MSDIKYYCSNCKAEVSKDDLSCPYCGLELEDMENSEEDAFTVVVKTFDSVIDANVAKDILSDEGIDSFLSENYLNSAYPSSLFNEAVYLYVMEKDFEKAYEILEGYDKAKPAQDDNILKKIIR